MKFAPLRHPLMILALLAAAAVAVHGYHLGVDDGEIYVPAIKKAADPALYSFGTEYFLSHAHMSLFPDLVGGSARLLRIPADLAILLWHLAGVFLLLAGCRKLACACFYTEVARWGGVALAAALLTVPAAGTALVIMDPYVTARTLSAPATVFAIACFLACQPKRAAAWLAFTALVHPQMSMYGILLIGLAMLARSTMREPWMVSLAALPLGFEFGPAHGVYREVLFSRSFFFVNRWAWYEWVGAFAPLAILWWMSRRKRRAGLPAFPLLCRTLVAFGLLSIAAGLLLTAGNLENFARLQPMRSFHLIYVLFFVMLGGMIGEYVLQHRRWAWAALFLPLGAGMWMVQSDAYPWSPHVEWPGAAYRSPWLSSFVWIRENTPKNAIFALDPDYLLLPEVDQHGFRAVAERAALADRFKDSGAVSLFPQLADGWKAQMDAQRGWSRFAAADFRQLAARYPVQWVLARRSAAAGMDCPYRNAELAVCRIR